MITANYIKTDLKLIFRDPILWILLFIPFIFIAMMRIGLPELINLWPAIEPYSLLLLATLCLVAAMFPALLYSFIMLDEKDENVLDVIRVLPVARFQFIMVRLLSITFFSFVFVFLLLSTAGVTSWSLLKNLLAALPYSLVGPVMTLFISGFARNKIEGATWMKGMNFILFLPLLSYFVEGPYEYLLGILPVYWLFKMIDPGFSQMGFSISFSLALFCHLMLLFAGVRIFMKRVMS